VKTNVDKTLLFAGVASIASANYFDIELRSIFHFLSW